MSQSVDIGICTFRRPQIVETLRSIAAMALPENIRLRVIVADNDSSPSAQVLVRAAAEDLGLTLEYRHAPERNISIARNACLDASTADYLAFIDDDQLCAPDWLSVMLQTFASTNADILVGPAIAIYPPESPDWLVEGDFHSNFPTLRAGTISTCYTGNVLIRRGAPGVAGLRFDPALGVTGGEDTVYFAQAHRAGAVIGYAERAIIYEPVPRARATLGWLIKRRFRYGHTHAIRTRQAGQNLPLVALFAALKALTCYAVAVIYLLHPVKKRAWLLRGMLHTGVVHYALFHRA